MNITLKMTYTIFLPQENLLEELLEHSKCGGNGEQVNVVLNIHK